MPPPTGVVSGPLMPMRWVRKVSTVSSGSQLPVSSNAFWPASTSFHATFLPYLAAAASSTSLAAGQMSTPVPSPSMNGMIGWSVTCSAPSGPWVMRSAMRRSLPAPLARLARWPRPRSGRSGRRSRGRRRCPRSGVGQAEGGVDLAGRARPVERVEVQPGHAGVEQLSAELGGDGHTFAVHGVSCPRGRRLPRAAPPSTPAPPRPWRPCGGSTTGGDRHDPGEHRLVHAPFGEVGRRGRCTRRPRRRTGSRRSRPAGSLAARLSRSVLRSADSGWPAGWAATPIEKPPMAAANSTSSDA